MDSPTSPPVDYEQLAPVYDRRYVANPLSGVGFALKSVVETIEARSVLEAGCGTGHWLNILQPVVTSIYGLDFSPGMLGQAKSWGKNFHLVRGRATELPFRDRVFDLVFCVNAIHHFGDPRAFIFEARRLLAGGGTLAVVGLDPHESKDSWYVYHYFDEAYQTDIQRFPTSQNLRTWMEAAGFEHLEMRIAEQIKRSWFGRDVFNDPFLKKESTSQLALLSDEAYAAGLERIEAAVSEAESGGGAIEFPSDLLLQMIIGYAGKVKSGVFVDAA
jgi:ubiquinone/menaquinone biosynthesis C-methylase UbiE